MADEGERNETEEIGDEESRESVRKLRSQLKILLDELKARNKRKMRIKKLREDITKVKRCLKQEEESSEGESGESETSKEKTEQIRKYVKPKLILSSEANRKYKTQESLNISSRVRS